MTDSSVSTNKELSFYGSYLYREVWFTATVAGCSLIFTIFAFLFLHAQLVPHALYYIVDPVIEMTGYAELFLLTFACYYVTGLLAYWKRRILSRFMPSFLPIAIVGSLIFSLYSWIRLSPEETPNTYFFVFIAISLLTVVAGAVGSAFRGEAKSPVTRKY